jgi:two-component system, OmpR family, phosphate regulon response regulator PhoB
MPAENRHTILVVEDDRPIRELVVLLLEEEGYEVVQAADGRAAIGLINQLAPPEGPLCLILLDMMLPLLDGLPVIDYLVQHGVRLPIIAMSASQAHLLAAQANGARAAIHKPFGLEQLLRAVSQHCLHAAPNA